MIPTNDMPGRNMEAALKQALRREQPSAGFTERVLGRLAESREQAQRHKQKLTRYWIAVAAMLLIATLITTEVRNRQIERHEAEAKAGQQLVMALKIASHQLRTTQRRIRRSINGT